MKPTIVIIGAGGHGKVVCDAILSENKYNLAGFIDSTLPVGTIVTGSYKVIATQENMDSLLGSTDFFIVAIGNNKTRGKLYNAAKKLFKPAIIVHASAIIGSNITVGNGSIVLANAVINTFSSIGENTIVNSGVIIDHECKVGSHVHLSIGTMIGSNSIIADYVLTSIGTNIPSFSKILS